MSFKNTLCHCEPEAKQSHNLAASRFDYAYGSAQREAPRYHEKFSDFPTIT
jgi:hypothetical protein